MSRQATDKKPESTDELVKCPRCDGGRKHGQKRRPYSFKRLTTCVGDCFLCCDMHWIPPDLAAAYLLVISVDGVVLQLATLNWLKRDLFGDNYCGF